MKNDDNKGFYVPSGPVDVFSINKDVQSAEAGSVSPDANDIEESEKYLGYVGYAIHGIEPPDNDLSIAQQFMSENYPEMFDEFLEIQESQLEMFCKKNMDYGLNNIDMGGDTINKDEDRMGALRGVTIRLGDKLNRLMNLVIKGNGISQNESVEDTYMDASVYSIIALIVSRRKWGK